MHGRMHPGEEAVEGGCQRLIWMLKRSVFFLSFASSLAPQAVDVWRAELRSKKKPKIAASVAHPIENGDLFEEGWEEALGREEEIRAAHVVNGDAGELSS